MVLAYAMRSPSQWQEHCNLLPLTSQGGDAQLAFLCSNSTTLITHLDPANPSKADLITTIAAVSVMFPNGKSHRCVTDISRDGVDSMPPKRSRPSARHVLSSTQVDLLPRQHGTTNVGAEQALKNPTIQDTSFRMRNDSLLPCADRISRKARKDGDPVLKPCLKHTKNLRRVKTVDFDKQMVVLPRLERSPKSPGARKGCSNTSLCAYPRWSMKGSLVEPAITHTDVHVIAIASPTSNDNDVDENESKSPTPTMQIIQSPAGSYQIVWDNVPREHTARLRRRASSASESLQACTSQNTIGLQRVNSKLSSWYHKLNEPPTIFRPSLVVFPDEDSHGGRPDSEDLSIVAPPNSQIPSRTVSAPITRMTSKEILDINGTWQEQDMPLLNSPWEFSNDQDATSPERQPADGVGKSRRVRQLAEGRKFSNVEEDEMRFRSHRDSVSLARTRLAESEGLSPSLFAHRDSVSMAKTRMAKKNHATSKVRQITRPRSDETSAAVSSYDEDECSLLPLPTVKEHAAQALRNKSSKSILTLRQPSDGRHIRIIE